MKYGKDIGNEIYKRIDNMKKFCLLFLLITSSLFAQEVKMNKYDRIWALSTVWKELSYNFAFPEKIIGNLNTDSLYEAYLQKVEPEMDNYAFYKVLSSYIAHYNEAHTRAYISNQWIDIPPLFATSVEGKIIVDNVSKDLEKDIPIGSEIIKINNILTDKYITDSVAIYISASTPQWKWNKSVLELFNGRPGSKLSIITKDKKGKEKEIILTRNYNQMKSNIQMVKAVEEPPITIDILKNNIAYIKLTSFMYPYRDSINHVFTHALPQLRKAKGLIIDIQRNRGGSDASWELIAMHLIKDKEFRLPNKYYSRKHIPTYAQWGKYYPQMNDYTKGIAMEEIIHSNYPNNVADSLKLNQPLVILSGKLTGSAAEDFLLLMKHVRKALVIGTPSVGCVGEPAFFPLTKDLGFQMCVKKFVLNDGSQPIDTGILPDIEVKETYQDYLKGKNSALDRALDELAYLIDK